MTVPVLLITLTSVPVKITVHPASHNRPMLRRFCEGAHDVAVFGARWQIWEEEFGLPNGLNALAIGDVDHCGWCIGGESCCRCLVVAVVMACPCVSDGSEVVVVM
jgi:hypothetical protein